jgi:hypothetical protein
MEIAGLLAILIGLIYVIGAIRDWNWIVNNRSTRLVSFIFGRMAARALALVAGLGFMAAGVWLLFIYTPAS